MSDLSFKHKSSNSEVLVYLPIAIRNVVLVQILLRVVPAHGVDTVVNLEDHG